MKILLFRQHQGDPLCAAISALTRGQYTHAAVLTDEKTLEIHEAFWPRVRKRQLAPEELPGLDVFSIAGLTPDLEAAALRYYDEHLGDRYSIEDLLRFLPFVRSIFGEENERAAQTHCFCSMYAFDGLAAAGLPLLDRVEGWQVCPNILSYSPLLTPAALSAP